MNVEKNSSKIVISVRQLRKTYTGHAGGKSFTVHALDGLSLDVNQGEILGILGPNGAGKTTLLNSLSTLLLPDSGSIEMLGVKSEPANFNTIRSFINMSSGYPNYPWVLTVRENLRFYGRLYGLSGKALEDKLNEVIDLFQLTSYADRRFDELSSGTKQRLSLAKSLLNDPKIVFLDEPTIGLDPDVALKTRDVVLNVLRTKNVTVLLTSHNMDEVEAMCDRVAFIKTGKILKLASISELKRLHHTDDLEKVFIHLAATEHNIEESINVDVTGMVNFVKREQPVLIRMKTWMNRVAAFTERNFLFAIRNLFVMTDVIFWPLISLLSIGLMAKFVQLGDSTMAFVMTGTIAAGVLQITQLDVGYTVLYELWSKSLKHTLLTPVGVSEGVIGTWLTGIVRGFVVFIFLTLCATWWFGFHAPDILTNCVFLLGLYTSALLLGMMVNMLILSFGQKVEITAWMFAHLFMIICGIYYPIDILPAFWQGVASLIPITYFLEYYRQSFGFTPMHQYPLLMGSVLTVVYFIVGIWGLRRSYTRARRRGVIIRLSE